ncbi:MazG-like family protein [Actinopolymorpha sp. B17G11]|uniref:MazG-like family protein n=1 Tax=Actinopolymorpha sp. B17G11 TaxID=3160861 RepID=UPI0032E39AF9
MEFATAQQRVWDNKVAKGFNVTDVPLEFCLLQGEVAEAFDAWRRKEPHLGEELADVALYLLSLARMTGVDLGAEVERKLAINARRRYERDERTGTLNRVVGEDPSGWER